MGSKAIQQGRRDANHKTVADGLRDHSWSVLDLAAAKCGTDLVVSKTFDGRPFCALVEIKDGSLSPSKRQLTPKEQQLKDNWDGVYIVALDLEDALAKLMAEQYLSGRGE
jgi:hypothetical protein